MAVRDDRSDVKQTTTGFRGPLMVQSLTSAKSKFLSLIRESGISPTGLAKLAGIPDSYGSEINKGINLSRFVQER